MAEQQKRGEEEKSVLGNSVRPVTSYGSTLSPPVRRHAQDAYDLFIKHIIQRDDTLHSVALTYGVAMNDIRSINNIWSDTHICLRDHLYIPVDKDSHPHLDTQTHPSIEVITRQQLLTLRKISKSVSIDQQLSKALTPTSSESQSTTSDASDPPGVSPLNTDIPIKDYFSKFDNSLAKIKDNIEKLEKTSAFQNSEIVDRGSRKRSTPNVKSWSIDIEPLDPTTEPQMRFLSSTNDPKLRQTLESLEKKQEELFEL